MIESGKKRKCDCGKCVLAIQIDTSDAGWKLAEDRQKKHDITEKMLDGFKRVIGHTYRPGLAIFIFSIDHVIWLASRSTWIAFTNQRTTNLDHPWYRLRENEFWAGYDDLMFHLDSVLLESALTGW